MKPIIKWVGGKSSVAKEIWAYSPDDLTEDTRLVEPFAGGLGFGLNLERKNYWFNDCNWELINLYTQVKKFPTEIMNWIIVFTNKYNLNPETFYYQLRDCLEVSDFEPNEEFNQEQRDIYRAARMMFLNKTNFNGLWRVNKDGVYNASWGKKLVCPVMINPSFWKMNYYFNHLKVKMTNLDYQKMLPMINKNDFVYLDPPYSRLNKNTFHGYNKTDFSQVELKKFCDNLTKKEVRWLQSNHDTNEIKELYKDYRVEYVGVSRRINSDASKRGKIQEILIKNY